MSAASPIHVCVCVCTHKRPALLQRTLSELAMQETRGRFVYSIVVADNDAAESSRQVVAEFRANSHLEVTYCVEPEQNIALARNRALANARGDFLAFIDDDEFPCRDWLANLMQTCEHYGASGALGPVRPHFEGNPPEWLVRGRFCERPEYPSGMELHWRQTRTGNVLLRHKALEGLKEPFRRELGSGGEDVDFFRRLTGSGHRFVWCNEAPVYELIPPERWRRSYMLRRALLRGQNERLLLDASSIAKSLLAVLVYTPLLLFMPLVGQHRFMSVFIRLCDHAGKLLGAVGWRPAGTRYVGH